MSDQGFADQLRQIAAAVSGSQASFVTVENNLRRVDERIRARLKAAELAAAANRNWAAERSREVAAVAEQGRELLPDAIDPGSEQPATVLATAADPRAGLLAALDKAQTGVNGIRDGGQGFAGWRKRRAAIMRGIAILLLLLMILLGILYFWRTMQSRAEQSAATQTAVAATAAPTLTAGAIASGATRKAEQTTVAMITRETEEAEVQQLTIEAEATTPPPTPQPPTRTPRPPPTPGPTPTSLPPGAIVCPGAFPTRLTVGGRARVINYQLNVRSGPGTNHSVVRRLDPGRNLDVLDGPVCDNGQLWYYILSEEIVPRDGSEPYRAEGWLVEESGETYFLEPLQ